MTSVGVRDDMRAGLSSELLFPYFNVDTVDYPAVLSNLHAEQVCPKYLHVYSDRTDHVNRTEATHVLVTRSSVLPIYISYPNAKEAGMP